MMELMEATTLQFPIFPKLVSRISEVNFDTLVFGREISDHMFIMEFRDGQWHNPRIEEYAPLPLMPASSALHYGQAIFEGMKAYRMADGTIAAFRPEMNCARFNRSAARMCMPQIPEDIFLSGLKELIKLDSKWVPKKDGYSLYIRPFMFATDSYIGIRPSETYTFIIFTCPVNAYYAEPVRVKVETHFTRASEGGTGAAKCAGNYAGALYPARLAQEQGFHQLLWTDGLTHEFFEESGTMNLMFYGHNTLYTPALTSTILGGITRDSILTLAKDWGVQVVEQRLRVSDMMQRIASGEITEAFGAGTAAVVAPIALINYQNTDYSLPAPSSDSFAVRLKTTLDDIRRGRAVDVHNWMWVIE